MSFAINFIIDHPEENKTDTSTSNLTNYHWDDFFATTANESSEEETIEQGFQEQGQRQLTPKDPIVQEPIIEHSPIPTLPINLPSPLPLLEATKPQPPTVLASSPPPPHLPSSNILPPIILPPLTPFAVHIPPPKKIELPTTNVTPPSEIVTPPTKSQSRHSNSSPTNKSSTPKMKPITPRLRLKRNSKIRPGEQELTRSSPSPKSSPITNDDDSTPKDQILPEFTLELPVTLDSPKENLDKEPSELPAIHLTGVTDEMQVDLLETSDDSQQQEIEENPAIEKLKIKQAWIKRMRLKFSVRPEFGITQNILHLDGSLNQDYFRPPKGSIPQIQRKWTDKERVLLIKGVEKYGIGHYKEISDELLPDWSAQDLRVKTMRLIGRQNLQLYKEWKGDENAIKVEYEKNKNIGLKTGMWKAGTLVYDDNGVVLKMIQELSGDSKKRKRNGQDILEEDDDTAYDEEIEID
ncbi:6121_t:CDS:2 [Funneliformis mosseae]|uniref:6121_t:CDS:1 n=1 Tax=Funneliformis mosseae TaxID=27381 RepID=A0A9N8WK59_FUNMO|nr:6121_t:CDS:2 [Funneliformis mosseae]